MKSLNVRARLLCAALGTVFLTVTGIPATAAGAKGYPKQAINLIVPFGAGSVTDLLGRMAADKIGQALGQPVVVQNKAGAGGNIGAAFVARAPADGYTLLMGPTSTNAVNPSLYPDLGFDPLRDFAPITDVAKVPNVLVVSSDVDANSVQELIALLKTKDLSYASGGTGGSQHLAGELFKRMTGTNMLHVPYKGGGAALPDLLAGRVQVMFCNIPLCLPHIKEGKLKALAVTSDQRSPLLPDVPTVMEAGVPGYDVTGWFGLFAPAGTDPSIIAKLNAAVLDALDQDDVKAFLLAQGAQPDGDTPENFARFVRSEHDKWAKLIKEAGITVE